MNVSPINNQEVKPTFSASIRYNELWKNCKTYLQNHLEPRPGYYNATTDLYLINKIEDAIKTHPSEADLEFSIKYITGANFLARGVVQSPHSTIIDIEPTRDDDDIDSIKHLFRKLLNPNNKDVFNKLMGEKYKEHYENWWNENIQPIWNEIVKTFRDPTYKESYNYSDWDERMNMLFRQENS